MQITITTNEDLIPCPCCGGTELYNPDAPVIEWRWRIKYHKIHDGNTWWSKCYDCGIWFNDNGEVAN